MLKRLKVNDFQRSGRDLVVNYSVPGLSLLNKSKGYQRFNYSRLFRKENLCG